MDATTFGSTVLKKAKYSRRQPFKNIFTSFSSDSFTRFLSDLKLKMLRVCGKTQSLMRNFCFRSFSAVKETQFTKLTHVDHILKRPGMYVGSAILDNSDVWLHNEKTNKMEKRTIGVSPALLKIFDEIIVNAADNHQRDKSMTKIEVNVKYVKKTKSLQISVKNDGLGIPVKMHETENVYIPEMIFGQLMTGSNFDDTEKRTVGGNHGHGAKLTNIFSKKFTVETYDKTRYFIIAMFNFVVN